MKRNRFILWFLLLCLLTGCGASAPKDVTGMRPVSDGAKERLDELIPISYEQLMDKMAGNGDFLVYLGRSDCMDCQAFRPILEEYVTTHTHSGMYTLDVRELREEKPELYAQLKADLGLQWVPTLYHIQNGSVLSKYQYLSEEYYALKSEEEQAAAEENAVQEFFAWMEQNTV